MKFKEKVKEHFRVLYSYSELEHLICHYNYRNYFVDIYEENIYIIDDIYKIEKKILNNNNIALFLGEEGIVIELKILLTDIDLVVNHGDLVCDNKELFYEYHFSSSIKTLSSLSQLLNVSFSDAFKKIIECKTLVINSLLRRNYGK